MSLAHRQTRLKTVLTLCGRAYAQILQAALGRNSQKFPYPLKLTASTRGISITATFFVFMHFPSSPLKPVRYAHCPAIACYRGTRTKLNRDNGDFSVLGTAQHVGDCSYSLLETRVPKTTSEVNNIKAVKTGDQCRGRVPRLEATGRPRPCFRPEPTL